VGAHIKGCLSVLFTGHRRGAHECSGRKGTSRQHVLLERTQEQMHTNNVVSSIDGWIHSIRQQSLCVQYVLLFTCLGYSTQHATSGTGSTRLLAWYIALTSICGDVPDLLWNGGSAWVPCSRSAGPGNTTRPCQPCSLDNPIVKHIVLAQRYMRSSAALPFVRLQLVVYLP
jgi:hypothetical protein